MTREKMETIAESLEGITIHEWNILKAVMDETLEKCVFEDSKSLVNALEIWSPH